VNAVRPAQVLKVVAALLVITETLYKLAEVNCFCHKVTMPRKKSKKHPMEMTDDEALKHLFHPEIVKAVRKHLKSQAKPEKKRKSKS
jgi:hypothetical protein